MNTSVFGRSLSFPLRVDASGRLAWSQDEDNIRESIGVILKTEPGERIAMAGFGAGLGRFLFEPNNVATYARIEDAIITALTRWEPRIRIEAVTLDEDPTLLTAALAQITYRLVATGALERLSVSVPLATA